MTKWAKSIWVWKNLRAVGSGIGHDAMMEQDAVHIGYEADVTAHLLDSNGKKIGVTGLLDTRAVVRMMPINTWERMGSTREGLFELTSDWRPPTAEQSTWLKGHQYQSFTWEEAIFG